MVTFEYLGCTTFLISCDHRIFLRTEQVWSYAANDDGVDVASTGLVTLYYTASIFALLFLDVCCTTLLFGGLLYTNCHITAHQNYNKIMPQQ